MAPEKAPKTVSETCRKWLRFGTVSETCGAFQLSTKDNLDYSWRGLPSLISRPIIIAITISKKPLCQLN